MASDELAFSLRGLNVDGLTRLYVPDIRDGAIFHGCTHSAWVLMDSEGEVQALSENDIKDEDLRLILRGFIRQYPVSPAVVGSALVECLINGDCRPLMATVQASLTHDGEGGMIASEDARKAEDAIRRILAHLPRHRVEALRYFIARRSESSLNDIWPPQLNIYEASERLVQVILDGHGAERIYVPSATTEDVFRELLFRARTLYLERPEGLSASHVYALFKPSKWTTNGEMFLDWLADFGDQGRETLTVEFPIRDAWRSSRAKANKAFEAMLVSLSVSKAEAVKAAMLANQGRPFFEEHYEAWCCAIDQGLNLLAGDAHQDQQIGPVRARFVYAPDGSFLF